MKTTISRRAQENTQAANDERVEITSLPEMR